MSWKCAKCGIKLTSKRNLENHQKRKIPCDQFKNTSKHMQTVHENSDEKVLSKKEVSLTGVLELEPVTAGLSYNEVRRRLMPKLFPLDDNNWKVLEEQTASWVKIGDFQLERYTLKYERYIENFDETKIVALNDVMELCETDKGTLLEITHDPTEIHRLFTLQAGMSLLKISIWKDNLIPALVAQESHVDANYIIVVYFDFKIKGIRCQRNKNLTLHDFVIADTLPAETSPLYEKMLHLITQVEQRKQDIINTLEHIRLSKRDIDLYLDHSRRVCSDTFKTLQDQ
jgi:hypothetical protein